MESRIAARKGRVYLDPFRNGFAQTVVAPYSVRRAPGRARLDAARLVRGEAGVEARAVPHRQPREAPREEGPLGGLLRAAASRSSRLSRRSEASKSTKYPGEFRNSSGTRSGDGARLDRRAFHSSETAEPNGGA